MYICMYEKMDLICNREMSENKSKYHEPECVTLQNLLDDVSSEDSDDNGSNERSTDDEDEWHELHDDDELEDEMMIDGVQIEESNEDVNFDIDLDQLQHPIPMMMVLILFRCVT